VSKAENVDYNFRLINWRLWRHHSLEIWEPGMLGISSVRARLLGLVWDGKGRQMQYSSIEELIFCQYTSLWNMLKEDAG